MLERDVACRFLTRRRYSLTWVKAIRPFRARRHRRGQRQGGWRVGNTRVVCACALRRFRLGPCPRRRRCGKPLLFTELPRENGIGSWDSRALRRPPMRSGRIVGTRAARRRTSCGAGRTRNASSTVGCASRTSWAAFASNGKNRGKQDRIRQEMDDDRDENALPRKSSGRRGAVRAIGVISSTSVVSEYSPGLVARGSGR